MLVVDVHELHGHVFPAELTRRRQGVVASQHLHRWPVDDERAVLRIRGEAVLDRLDVPTPRIAIERAKRTHRHPC
jgi:hypothetical protein